MYDKFDEDIEKSGLRFDGNEPTFNRRKIRRIIKRVLLAAFIIIFVLTFVERQRYNHRHTNQANIHNAGRGCYNNSGF